MQRYLRRVVRLQQRMAVFPLLGMLVTLAVSAQMMGQAPATHPAEPASTRPHEGPPPPPVPIDPKLPTIFIIGDSTARNGVDLGWGDHLAHFFNTKRINVANRAHAGRSSKTFTTEGTWAAVVKEIKPGDFVLMQFGHNDGGSPDKGKARGSLPGIGNEQENVTLPDGTKEVAHTFGWYNRQFIADTKAKGATPILLSPTIRNIWKDRVVEHEMGHYGEWLKEIARQEDVAFVDVSKIMADYYQALGPQKMAPYFPIDHTHTSPQGAELNASFVVAGLKGMPHSPFRKYLNAKGKAVKAIKTTGK
ncbi:MAG: rhamnogalacturonan acetylesterase [Acidobacteriaceae bacterium]